MQFLEASRRNQYLGPPKGISKETLEKYQYAKHLFDNKKLSIDKSCEHSTISYKDYKYKSKTKQLTLKNEEFVRRFSLHILPKRFVRIWHYGTLSSSWKRGKLQQLQERLNVVRPEIQVKIQHRKCFCCKTGNLITLHIFGQRGPLKLCIRPTNYRSANFLNF